MFTAIVWIGKYGSWSQGGFATHAEAERVALSEIVRGAFGSRTDLRADVEPAR